MTDNELMLLLQSNPDFACAVNDMIPRAKKVYVDAKHTQKISVVTSKSKTHDGKIGTHVYINGKRKWVEKATEDELYDYLFNHYQSLDDQLKTFEEVFEMFVEDKRTHAISEHTIIEYRRYFNYIDDKIRGKRIFEITENELRTWLVDKFLLRKPKKEALRKMLQIIGMVFKFGIKKRLCIENPINYIQANEYYKLCDLSERTNEERSFSPEEIDQIRAYALEHSDNPHAVMILIAIETGMRAGELAALLKSDIEGDILHIHRQQSKVPRSKTTGKQTFVDLEYTKNERQNPKGGRLLPISDECRKSLDLALALPGESKYVFHHPDGSPVQKDCYGRYLSRACKKLGIATTHNHAFRVAFNAKLIEAGVDGNERCLVLGHSMQTNERHYSFSDRRRVEDVRNKLNMLKTV